MWPPQYAPPPASGDINSHQSFQRGGHHSTCQCGYSCSIGLVTLTLELVGNVSRAMRNLPASFGVSGTVLVEL